MSTSWPNVKLGEVLRRSQETLEIEPGSEYCEVTVRLWGKGVVQRGLVSGSEISGSRRFAARAGQLILSRIDARNGAIGIVPPALDGATVTNDFPVFDVDTSRTEPAFLGWLSKTPDFVELCKRASEGTTNRVRLQEARFLALEIPMPALAEQRRIVARVEELAAKIAEARSLRQKAIAQVEAFIISVHAELARGRTTRLGDMVTLDEDQVHVEPNGSYPQVGVKSFGAGLFGKASVSGADTKYKAFNRLYDGALVLSQVKGWEGAVAICPHDLADRFVSPEYRTFRCIDDEARPAYLALLVRTEWFWGQLSQATRGVGARRERTRPEQFLDIQVLMPDVTRQTKGERLFARVSALHAIQARTIVELDALMPSVLDKAFKGEL